MISPALQDPRTVLVLLKGTPMSVIFAMCQDDSPKPCPVNWLVDRTGYARGPIEAALRKLKSWELVVQRGIKKASAWWLCHGIRQLALPFVKSLPATATIPFLPTLGSEPAVPGHHLPDGGDGSDPASPGNRSPVPTLGSEPAVPGHHLPDGGETIMLQKNALSSQKLLDPILKNNLGSKILDPTTFEEMTGKNALSAVLLQWIGWWETTINNYSQFPPEWILACYWYAKANNYREAGGYVHTCLDNRQKATSPYQTNALSWLEMDNDHRQILLVATQKSSTNGNRILLPNGFGYYVAYREFFLTWRACQGQIAPPSLMPENDPDSAELARLRIPQHLAHIIKR